jgi:hydrogenase maturation protein HypF
LTSSCGRLFDGVAALIGLRQTVNYEAQAAIELEMAIDPGSSGGQFYPLTLAPQGDGWTIGTRTMFDALLRDLSKGVSVADMSRRFHDGLIHIFAEVAERTRCRTGLNRVCLSGGSFNNAYLCDGLESRLWGAGFEVFTQNEVPSGDGGLSLGQALIAAHGLKAGADENTRMVRPDRM